MADAGSKQLSKPQAKTAEVQRGVRPWQPFLSLRQEMDRLMDEFDGGFGRFPSRLAENILSAGIAPAIDFAETEQGFEVTAELPGIAEKDVHVEVVNGELRIKGETKEEKEEKRKDYYFAERRHGSFERRVRLPESVDADKIEATFKNGLLTVALPKTPEMQKAAKRIPIKSA